MRNRGTDGRFFDDRPLGGRVDGQEFPDGQGFPEGFPDEELEPNGGIVAAVVAAGFGCAALGVVTVAAAAYSSFSDFLTLYAPAGPLTGKATVATLIYLIAWVNLHARLRDRELHLFRAFLLTMALLMIGLIGTFPPVYQIFLK
jgi:hypothetical protein